MAEEIKSTKQWNSAFGKKRDETPNIDDDGFPRFLPDALKKMYTQILYGSSLPEAFKLWIYPYGVSRQIKLSRRKSLFFGTFKDHIK